MPELFVVLGSFDDDARRRARRPDHETILGFTEFIREDRWPSTRRIVRTSSAVTSFLPSCGKAMQRDPFGCRRRSTALHADTVTSTHNFRERTETQLLWNLSSSPTVDRPSSVRHTRSEHAQVIVGEYGPLGHGLTHSSFPATDTSKAKPGS